jgi:hypothetical protein
MSFPISTTEGEVRIVEKTLDAAGAEVLISEDGELYQAVPGEVAIPYEGSGDLACDKSTTSDVTAIGDEPELELAQDVRHADTVAEGGAETTTSELPGTEEAPEGVEQTTTDAEPETTAEPTTGETTDTAFDLGAEEQSGNEIDPMKSA